MFANFRLVVFVRPTAPHCNFERPRTIPWSKPIQTAVRFFIAWRWKKRPARRTRRLVWFWPQIVYEEHGVCLHGRPRWILNPPDSSGWPSPRGADHDSLLVTAKIVLTFKIVSAWTTTHSSRVGAFTIGGPHRAQYHCSAVDYQQKLDVCIFRKSAWQTN